MDIKNYATKVREMLKAQEDYFKAAKALKADPTRYGARDSALKKSKILESEVKKMTYGILEGEQQSLFK